MKINKNSLEYQASWYVAALTNMNPILLDRLFIDVCNRVPDAFPGLNGEIEKAISSTLDLDGSESSNSEIESSISSNEEKSQSQDCQLQIAIVRKLMYLGANINIYEGGLSGGAPIHYACHNNNYPLVWVLVKEFGADTCIKDGSHMTPLEIAEQNNFSDIAELLVGHSLSFTEVYDS